MSDTPSSALHVTVEAEDAGSRLDRFLAAKLTEMSRSRLQALIRDGAVTLAGKTIGDAGIRVKLGDVYDLLVPEPQAAVPEGESIALDVVYEDDAIIVINKPAGLVVHPGAGHQTGTLVNALIAHCGDSLSGIGGVRRPGIVHRLDKDTSGLLVVAKSDQAHKSLSKQFAAHGRDGRLQRRYQAMVWGGLERPHGIVEAPLARSTINRTKIAVSRTEFGREAITHWQIERLFRDKAGKPVATLVALQLETGRTHQIRVHMAHLGHPVMGDDVYGAGFKTASSRLPPAARDALIALSRQALHAATLGFEHPITGEPMSFDRPPPADMALLIRAMEDN